MTAMPPVVSRAEWEIARAGAGLAARKRFMMVFDLLDLTPYGRQETWEELARGLASAGPVRVDAVARLVMTARFRSLVAIRAECVEIIASVNYD
jgi:hypothetical protein